MNKISDFSPIYDDLNIFPSKAGNALNEDFTVLQRKGQIGSGAANRFFCLLKKQLRERDPEESFVIGPGLISRLGPFLRSFLVAWPPSHGQCGHQGKE